MSFNQILKARHEISLNVSSGESYDFVEGEIHEVEFGTFEEFMQIWAMGHFDKASSEDLQEQEILVIDSPFRLDVVPSNDFPFKSSPDSVFVDCEDVITSTNSEVDTPDLEVDTPDPEVPVIDLELDPPTSPKEFTTIGTTCPVCGNVFKSAQGLKIHLGKAHKD